jgi:hypothetical protein
VLVEAGAQGAEQGFALFRGQLLLGSSAGHGFSGFLWFAGLGEGRRVT